MMQGRTLADVKELLTLKEAAALLGRNVSNLYRWVKNGTLPFEYGDDGRTVVVRKSAVIVAEAKNFRHGKNYRTKITESS